MTAVDKNVVIPCEVIGCTPRPSTVWLPDEGVFACLRCALELMELQRVTGAVKVAQP